MAEKEKSLKVEVRVGIRSLPCPLPGIASAKKSVFIVAYREYDSSTDEVMRTETSAPNVVDTNFIVPIRLKYIPSKRQSFKLRVYCCKGPTETAAGVVPFTSTAGLPLDDADLYGIAECTLGEVMTAPGYTVFEPMMDAKGETIVKGKVMLAAVVVDSSSEKKGSLHVKLAGKDLPKLGAYGKPDPFVLLYKQSASGSWDLAWSTEPGRKTTDPEFTEQLVSFSALADGDLNRPVKVEVRNWVEVGEENPLLAECVTSVQAILDASAKGPAAGFKLTHPSKTGDLGVMYVVSASLGPLLATIPKESDAAAPKPAASVPGAAPSEAKPSPAPKPKPVSTKPGTPKPASPLASDSPTAASSSPRGELDGTPTGSAAMPKPVAVAPAPASTDGDKVGFQSKPAMRLVPPKGQKPSSPRALDSPRGTDSPLSVDSHVSTDSFQKGETLGGPPGLTSRPDSLATAPAPETAAASSDKLDKDAGPVGTALASSNPQPQRPLGAGAPEKGAEEPNPVPTLKGPVRPAGPKPTIVKPAAKPTSTPPSTEAVDSSINKVNAKLSTPSSERAQESKGKVESQSDNPTEAVMPSSDKLSQVTPSKRENTSGDVPGASNTTEGGEAGEASKPDPNPAEEPAKSQSNTVPASTSATTKKLTIPALGSKAASPAKSVLPVTPANPVPSVIAKPAIASTTPSNVPPWKARNMAAAAAQGSAAATPTKSTSPAVAKPATTAVKAGSSGVSTKPSASAAAAVATSSDSSTTSLPEAPLSLPAEASDTNNVEAKSGSSSLTEPADQKAGDPKPSDPIKLATTLAKTTTASTTSKFPIPGSKPTGPVSFAGPVKSFVPSTTTKPGTTVGKTTTSLSAPKTTTFVPPKSTSIASPSVTASANTSTTNPAQSVPPTSIASAATSDGTTDTAPATVEADMSTRPDVTKEAASATDVEVKPIGQGSENAPTSATPKPLPPTRTPPPLAKAVSSSTSASGTTTSQSLIAKTTATVPATAPPKAGPPGSSKWPTPGVPTKASPTTAAPPSKTGANGVVSSPKPTPQGPSSTAAPVPAPAPPAPKPQPDSGGIESEVKIDSDATLGKLGRAPSISVPSHDAGITSVTVPLLPGIAPMAVILEEEGEDSSSTGTSSARSRTERHSAASIPSEGRVGAESPSNGTPKSFGLHGTPTKDVAASSAPVSSTVSIVTPTDHISMSRKTSAGTLTAFPSTADKQPEEPALPPNKLSILAPPPSSGQRGVGILDLGIDTSFASMERGPRHSGLRAPERPSPLAPGLVSTPPSQDRTRGDMSVSLAPEDVPVSASDSTVNSAELTPAQLLEQALPIARGPSFRQMADNRSSVPVTNVVAAALTGIDVHGNSPYATASHLGSHSPSSATNTPRQHRAEQLRQFAAMSTGQSRPLDLYEVETGSALTDWEAELLRLQHRAGDLEMFSRQLLMPCPAETPLKAESLSVSRPPDLEKNQYYVRYNSLVYPIKTEGENTRGSDGLVHPDGGQAAVLAAIERRYQALREAVAVVELGIPVAQVCHSLERSAVMAKRQDLAQVQQQLNLALKELSAIEYDVVGKVGGAFGQVNSVHGRLVEDDTIDVLKRYETSAQQLRMRLTSPAAADSDVGIPSLLEHVNKHKPVLERLGSELTTQHLAALAKELAELTTQNKDLQEQVDAKRALAEEDESKRAEMQSQLLHLRAAADENKAKQESEILHLAQVLVKSEGLTLVSADSPPMPNTITLETLLTAPFDDSQHGKERRLRHLLQEAELDTKGSFELTWGPRLNALHAEYDRASGEEVSSGQRRVTELERAMDTLDDAGFRRETTMRVQAQIAGLDAKTVDVIGEKDFLRERIAPIEAQIAETKRMISTSMHLKELKLVTRQLFDLRGIRYKSMNRFFADALRYPHFTEELYERLRCFTPAAATKHLEAAPLDLQWWSSIDLSRVWDYRQSVSQDAMRLLLSEKMTVDGPKMRQRLQAMPQANRLRLEAMLKQQVHLDDAFVSSNPPVSINYVDILEQTLTSEDSEVRWRGSVAGLNAARSQEVEGRQPPKPPPLATLPRTPSRNSGIVAEGSKPAPATSQDSIHSSTPQAQAPQSRHFSSPAPAPAPAPKPVTATALHKQSEKRLSDIREEAEDDSSIYSSIVQEEYHGGDLEPVLELPPSFTGDAYAGLSRDVTAGSQDSPQTTAAVLDAFSGVAHDSAMPRASAISISVRLHPDGLKKTAAVIPHGTESDNYRFLDSSDSRFQRQPMLAPHRKFGNMAVTRHENFSMAGLASAATAAVAYERYVSMPGTSVSTNPSVDALTKVTVRDVPVLPKTGPTRPPVQSHHPAPSAIDIPGPVPAVMSSNGVHAQEDSGGRLVVAKQLSAPTSAVLAQHHAVYMSAAPTQSPTAQSSLSSSSYKEEEYYDDTSPSRTSRFELDPRAYHGLTGTAVPIEADRALIDTAMVVNPPRNPHVTFQNKSQAQSSPVASPGFLLLQRTPRSVMVSPRSAATVRMR